MFKTYLAIMLGGAIGTGLRAAISGLMAAKYGQTFPFGTILVNVSGCFIIGAFSALTGPEGSLLASPLFRQTVMIGVLGGYTTFSSFALQTLVLSQDGEWLRAGLNVTLSFVLCLLAVWAGHLLVTFSQPR